MKTIKDIRNDPEYIRQIAEGLKFIADGNNCPFLREAHATAAENADEIERLNMTNHKSMNLDISDGSFDIFTTDGKTAYVGVECRDERTAINDITKVEMMTLGHSILSVASSMVDDQEGN